jgi:hypothetical protein
MNLFLTDIQKIIMQTNLYILPVTEIFLPVLTFLNHRENIMKCMFKKQSYLCQHQIIDVK